ncbi:WD40 repeat-like protein [Phialemonium atrogriseum]|uniref:WD40 repeat-like protein n=1 Tax=Phialemonium atrogriseum TaxID=1093897 RepID=A0AAJ0C897_9PEZI|nr:WD40 repeat-like protein [Phialemonium atrogriseum]KAK1770808.1 WD40 repeat-like protein [Phialemonium atrogriseum]
MAAEVAALAQLKLASGPSPITAEQKYWKSFKNPKLHTSTASWPITHISFPAPSAATATSSSLATAAKSNDLFAVTSGPRVDVYSIRKREPLKTIGRFEHVARSGEIRADSRVLVAGDDSGKMQVFDVAGGARSAVLKTWHTHKQPVWVTKWSPTEMTTLMSGSDDKTVRLWDLPSNTPTRTFSGHQDYVRCGAFMPGPGAHGNTLVSGSYDTTVRLWDPRSPGGAILTFKHTAPVETVLPLPSGTTILAASGTTISVLDLVAAKPLHIISNHQKTVTSLCLASNGRRVISGGLDGHVKVFDTSNWKVVAGSKYPSPILSLSVISAGANHSDRHLAVGMQSGVLSLRTRLTGAAAERDRAREAERSALDAGADAVDRLDAARARRARSTALGRSMEMLGETVDFVIPTNEDKDGKRKRRVRQQPWQKDLRHGRHGQALDAVLESPSPNPLTALTLLVALRHRSALRDALAGRDEVSVQPVLRWVSRHIVDPRYAPVCVDVGLHLLDLYGEFVGGSAELAEGFRVLRMRVVREAEKAQMACQTNGMLESLLVGAATRGA